jgi:hypothetical protein
VPPIAGVAELADAQDLKSCGFLQTRTGSSPVSGTLANLSYFLDIKKAAGKTPPLFEEG